jgi:hypothetical protein
MFVEDPICPENADAMARVADRLSVPTGTGERFCTIYEFQALLARDALEFARVVASQVPKRLLPWPRHITSRLCLTIRSRPSA